MHTFIIKYLAFWVCGKIGYLERNDIKKHWRGFFSRREALPEIGVYFYDGKSTKKRLP